MHDVRSKHALMQDRHSEPMKPRGEFVASNRIVKYDLKPLRVANGGVPRAGWVRWVQPRPALPIDEEIAALIDEGWIERADKTIACPYAMGRSGVAAGILQAMLAASNVVIGDGEISLRDFEAAAKDLKRTERVNLELNALRVKILSLARLAETYRPHETPPASAETDAAMLRSFELNVLQLICDLPSVARIAEREHLRVSQNQGNAWKIAFATTVGVCWFVLTGAEPSPTGRFAKFISAAWCSIRSPAPADEPWERAVRTACERRRGRWAAWHPSPTLRHDEPPRIKKRGLRPRQRR